LIGWDDNPDGGVRKPVRFNEALFIGQLEVSPAPLLEILENNA